LRWPRSQQATNAIDQPSPARTQGQRGAGPSQILEVGQRRDIRKPISTGVDDDVVAAVFTLDADLPRAPPHGRVIEQQRFNRCLPEVDEIVVPPDVSELVCDHGLEVGDWQSADDTRRQQNHGTQAADDRGDVDDR
jgi:hypothetical protein